MALDRWQAGHKYGTLRSAGGGPVLSTSFILEPAMTGSSRPRNAASCRLVRGNKVVELAREPCRMRFVA